MDFSENLVVLVGVTVTITITFGFSLMSRKISKFLCLVTRFTIFGKPVRYENSLKTLYTFSRIFFCYCITDIMIYCLNAYAKSVKCIKQRRLNGINMVCRTILPFWWPYPLSYSKEWLLFVNQLMCLSLVTIPGALICNLIWDITQLIVMHFNVLKLAFPIIITDPDEYKKNYMMKLWIMYHLRIIRLSRKLNSLTKKIVGICSLGAPLILGSLFNMLSNSEKIAGAVFNFIGFFTSFCFLVNAGQKLEDAGESLSDAIYNSNWCDVDIKTKQSIQIIMMSSRIKVNLSAVPIGTLNHGLLVVAMKGSYSYFSLLTQIK